MQTAPTVPPDILVIGVGPARLTAATYLARFRRRVCVIDGGASRVVRGLSQISVAAGQAAVAATHMNASLPFPRPLG